MRATSRRVTGNVSAERHTERRHGARARSINGGLLCSQPRRLHREEREKRKTGKTERESGPGRRQAAAACYCRGSPIVESSGDIARDLCRGLVRSVEGDDDEFGRALCWSRESDTAWNYTRPTNDQPTTCLSFVR